ncbi:MAG: DUF1819 family protein [Desulfobulbaceae bacterium]|uniref:DUF1819 family protein n=1 Tax=Candidatus Desulfobia pelagia TaxID=2841692 RepID=A0A8J6TB36_9BACT|nr:DUF1819 family protein [Candidatus Desulfobia pelagia]
MSLESMKNSYKMSFTTGGLFYNESLQIAALYDTIGDWPKTRDQVLSENLLQTRTESSAKRRIWEICSRLELLTEGQIQLLISGSRQEQQYLLWIAVCKHYSFIRDFMIEVVREKFLRMDLHIQAQDYEIFYDNKAEWHAELEKLRDSTRTRLRQALFQIMREAEIISREDMIIPCLLTEELTKVLAADNSSWITVLPVSDMDINAWLA